MTPAAPAASASRTLRHPVGDAVHQHGGAGRLRALDVVGDLRPVAERQVEHDDVALPANPSCGDERRPRWRGDDHLVAGVLAGRLQPEPHGLVIVDD